MCSLAGKKEVDSVSVSEFFSSRADWGQKLQSAINY